MAESEVVRTIRRQREEVARNELETLKRLARLWVPSYRYLQRQFDDLVSLIQKKRDAGEPVQVEYLYSLQRYQRMMAQAKKMVRDYNSAAAGQIHGSEVEMVELGKQNAQRTVSIAEPDDPMWTRVNKRETRIAAGMTAEDAPLDRLLDKSFGQMKEGMEQALITGISTGQGSSWIAQQLMYAAEIPEQRALLIARTEVNRAYRQSNWEQMQSSRAIRGYRRMCYPETACFACLMLDGEFYPIDSEPCDHPNGKCSFVPVTRHFDPANDPNWQRGRDWFMEQDEDTQRKIMGPGRFDLWKQQGVDPRSMVYIKPNNVWGGSPAIRTLESIREFQSVALGSESNLGNEQLDEETKKEIIETGKRTLKFFHHLDPIYQYAQGVEPEPGFQDIFVHGGDTGFMFKDYGDKVNRETPINVREFADFVKDSKVYNGGKIRLVSCGTGNITAQTAAWFAEEMGVEVLAPTEDVNLWWDYFDVHNAKGEKGSWRRFYPNGRSEDY